MKLRPPKLTLIAAVCKFLCRNWHAPDQVLVRHMRGGL